MVQRSVLEDIIESRHEQIKKETVIARDLTDALIESISMEEITVLTGVRRSGKTFMLYDMLRRRGGTYINFEDERLMGFGPEDFEKLLDIAGERPERILYLDEVQEAPGWEKFAHRAHRNIKLFVTGSNSCLLSGTLSKALVGRTRTFVSRPLDFGEFLRFKGLNADRAALLEYMRLGGFPRIVLTGETALAREYLDRMVYHDVLGASDVRNPRGMMDLALYLLSNVGKEFSYRSLMDVTGLRNDETIRDYIGLLETVYLFSVISRYSGSVRKQRTYPKKIYAVDPALIGLGKRLDDDRGLVLENIVYNHLSGSWDVNYLKNGPDVDFLLCKGTRPVEAINVTFEVSGKEALARESSGLSKVARDMNVKARLVSAYAVNGLPDNVEGELAHRFLSRKPAK